MTLGVMSMGRATTLHSFGTRLMLAANPKCQRSSPFHPLVPSPPLLPPAVLYVSCNCRACPSSGHSGQTRETMGARREPCRWAADLLHSASAAFWGRASAKAQSLAEKKHKQGKFAGGHLRLAGSEDGTLNSKKDSQKETIRR